MATQTPADDNAGSDSKHTILTLPLEIFEQIAQVAEPKTLINIRLVNREACEKVQRTFTEVHFTKRAFLLSNEDSLLALAMIAKHRTFGPAMREIYLCIEELPDMHDPPNGVSLEDRMTAAIQTPTCNPVLYAQRFREWERLLREQFKLTARDGDNHLLIAAFSNFRRHGNNPAVIVTDQAESGVLAKSTTSLEMLTGEKLQLSQDVDRCVDITLDALHVSQFAPASFTICFGNSLWDIYLIGACPTARAWTRSIFHGLKHLHIRTEQPHEVEQQEAENTASMFDYCANLETIRLDRYSFYDDLEEPSADNYFISTFFDQTMPVLKTLNIRGFPLPLRKLVRYIKKHEKLERAIFEGCRFHTLEELDDGENDKKGKHDDCVAKVLREASGLQDIEASLCTVRDWEVREEA